MANSSEEIFDKIFYKGRKVLLEEDGPNELVFVVPFKELVNYNNGDNQWSEFYEDSLFDISSYYNYDKKIDYKKILNNSIIVIESFDEEGLDGLISISGMNQLICSSNNDRYELLTGTDLYPKYGILEIYYDLKNRGVIIDEFITQRGKKMLEENFINGKLKVQ